MRALRVRLVGVGASLVLGVTSLVGAGWTLAENNVHAVCNNVDVATSGRTNWQSITIVQGNSTVARDGTLVSGGTNVRCVAIATGD